MLIAKEIVCHISGCLETTFSRKLVGDCNYFQVYIFCSHIRLQVRIRNLTEKARHIIKSLETRENNHMTNYEPLIAYKIDPS